MRSYQLVKQFILVAALMAAFPACKLLDKDASKSSSKSGAGSQEMSAEPSGSVMTSTEKQKFYLWLVSEMHEQVFLRPVTKDIDLGGWVNVFAQGGSIEGVYHGLVYSTKYTALEQGRADIKVVRWFAQEMAFIDNADTPELTKKVELEAKKYAQDSLQFSTFALKRMIGEKVLKEVDKRKNNKSALSKFYATLASHWAAEGVDFGVPDRNKADVAFHEKWAQANSVGLIQWELLNRTHRMINSLSGMVLSK